MELVRGLQNIPKAARGCVLTVGNYDGVHLGHQQMIAAVKRRAAELGAPATVLVFEPSSKEFIDPEGAPPRLTRWREKYVALAAAGVERLVTLRFDECMRAMTPHSFVEDLMVAGLGVRHVVVGHDFRYGSNAGGTALGSRRSSPSWSTACASAARRCASAWSVPIMRPRRGS
jgi:riboflavin kinase/FMN adenylyltransferase